MGQAVDEGEDGHQNEEADEETQGRRHEVFLLADDELKEPDEEDRAQRGIQERWA